MRSSPTLAHSDTSAPRRCAAQAALVAMPEAICTPSAAMNLPWCVGSVSTRRMVSSVSAPMLRSLGGLVMGALLHRLDLAERDEAERGLALDHFQRHRRFAAEHGERGKTLFDRVLLLGYGAGQNGRHGLGILDPDHQIGV